MSKRDAQKGIEQACRRLEQQEPAPSLAELARDAGFSPGHFQRLFVAALGVSPKSYGVAARRRRLDAALRQAGSVTQAIYEAGYAGSSGAYRDSQLLGMPPARIRPRRRRRDHPACHGRFDAGVIVCRRNASGHLRSGVRPGGARRWHRCASGSRGHDWNWRMSSWRSGSKGSLPGWTSRAGNADLPLDIRGTAFQLRVWKETDPDRARQHGLLCRARAPHLDAPDSAPRCCPSVRIERDRRRHPLPPGLCAAMAHCRVIAGAWTASAACSSRKAPRSCRFADLSRDSCCESCCGVRFPAHRPARSARAFPRGRALLGNGSAGTEARIASKRCFMPGLNSGVREDEQVVVLHAIEHPLAPPPEDPSSAQPCRLTDRRRRYCRCSRPPVRRPTFRCCCRPAPRAALP